MCRLVVAHNACYATTCRISPICYLAGKAAGAAGGNEDAESLARKAAEEEERKRVEARAHGAPVTKEAFKAWKERYDAEVALQVRKCLASRTCSMYGRKRPWPKNGWFTAAYLSSLHGMAQPCWHVYIETVSIQVCNTAACIGAVCMKRNLVASYIQRPG